MSAGSKPLRPWQVCAGDVIGSGKRVEYVFERYGELYINASDESLVPAGKANVWRGAYKALRPRPFRVEGHRPLRVRTRLRGTKLV